MLSLKLLPVPDFEQLAARFARAVALCSPPLQMRGVRRRISQSQSRRINLRAETLQVGQTLSNSNFMADYPLDPRLLRVELQRR